MSAKESTAKAEPTFADAIAHAAPRAGLAEAPDESHVQQWAGRLGRLLDQARRTEDPGVRAELMALAGDLLGHGAVQVAAWARHVHEFCDHLGIPRPAALVRFEGTVAGAAKDELPRADAKKG